MSLLYHTDFLHPNHYTSPCSLDVIQDCIEESCYELDIDYSYEDTCFEYKCRYYYKYRIVGISINLFHYKDKYLIEIQDVCGDGFGYVKIVSLLRYSFQEKGLIQTHYGPYVDIEEPLSTLEITTDYIRSLIDTCLTASYSVQVESIHVLATISEHHESRQAMIQPYVVQQLLTLIQVEDIFLSRCVVSILVNLLYSVESDFVAHLLKEWGVKGLLDPIQKKTLLPIVKRECTIISAFIE
jgi:hypothetical protein